MDVKLPHEKVQGIKQQCQELLHQSQATVLLAKVIANWQQQSRQSYQVQQATVDAKSKSFAYR